VSPYAGVFFRPGLEDGVWEDFVEVQEVLRESPVEGRVYAWSGRYFYLLTPWMSGRPLAAEAFHGYLEQRGTAGLRATAFLDDGRMETYLRVAGVSHLLVDTLDPDVGRGMAAKLRGMFPVVHENGSMLLLEVPEALGYGFLARDVVVAGDDAPVNALAALGGAAHGLAVLRVGEEEAGGELRGKVVEGGRIAPAGGGVLEEGKGFVPLERRGWGYGWAAFEGVDEGGWMIFNESWHPDWRVFVEGREGVVVRAMSAFGAVRVGAGEEVRWELRPPWWYGVCVWTGLGGWVVAALVGGVRAIGRLIRWSRARRSA
jgi:hypothetical protein